MNVATIIRPVVLILFLVTSAGVYGAGNGDNPKGKPFVAINDQIVMVEGAITSLQDQIDDLVGRVDSIEARVTANEDAILTLQAQNGAIQALVDQNVADIASIEGLIIQLQSDNANLLSLISSNSGDIAALQDEVDANEALITTLQSALLMVQDDLISLETSLQAQIDNNLILIGVLQSEVTTLNADITLKQNLVNGVCPSGEAIQQILPDGSVICEGAGGGTSGQLQSVYSYVGLSLDPGESGTALAYCPSGYTVTGSGFSGSGMSYNASYTGGNSLYSNYAHVRARNNFSFTHTFYAIATCTRIIP